MVRRIASLLVLGSAVFVACGSDDGDSLGYGDPATKLCHTFCGSN